MPRTAIDLWPNHTVAWCWDRCYSSAKQRLTRGISTRSCGSESDSSSAMGKSGHIINPRRYPPVDTGNCTVSHEKKFPQTQWTLVHGKYFGLAHPSQRHGALQPPSRTIHWLQMTFLDWYSKYVEPSQKTTIPYRVSRGHSTSPWQLKWASYHIYIVG